MVQEKALSSASGCRILPLHPSSDQTLPGLSISLKYYCRKREKGSIWVRKYEKERTKKKKLKLKGTEGCGVPHSFSNGPSSEGRRMKQGVFAAKVDTCLLYWCAVYTWIACGARTNVPALHSSRKWSLRLHSLCLWVTCWETQARAFSLTIHCMILQGSRTAKSLPSHRWPQYIWSLKCWLGFSPRTGGGPTYESLFAYWSFWRLQGFAFPPHFLIFHLGLHSDFFSWFRLHVFPSEWNTQRFITPAGL